MTSPKCPVRACPVRYRGGPDRLCAQHQDGDGDIIAAAAALGIEVAARRKLVFQPSSDEQPDHR